VEERWFFDGGASRNAYKHEGKKTLAYEIAEQSGWQPPDVVVAPVAVGETFIATARGFREMAEAGWIARVPRMVAAQATRANAVVRAFQAGGPITPLKIGYTVAEGLAAGDPGRKGAWALRLLREQGGEAGDADDDAILAMQGRLARTEGVWAGPTGVASLAVLARLIGERRLDPEQRFCVIVTETGLKTEAPAPSRDARTFDLENLRRLVQARLGVQ
jgi:threonine synthase